MKYVLFRAAFFLLLISNAFTASGQAPFTKGINLTNWFQSSSAKDIQFTKFSRKDLEHIKSLGCDVIRLPVNLHAMTSGEPDYILDPLFLNFLDQVATWAEELGLHLIIDNHTFDPSANTSPEIGPILIKVWTQMAEHYKNRSDHICYEVLNEPHGIGDEDWGDIQQSVIDAIRMKDTKHYIIVGPANWNSYNNLGKLPQYTDPKLIYTFHFYDPFVFTHQGATWTDPSMISLSGVPFPYNASAMPPVPADLKGTWIESAMNNYPAEGTISKIKSLIDIAAGFQSTRHAPVFCGEFGVYMPNSDNTDRVKWYEAVRKYLEEKNIAWTTWDYQGGFGLFEKGSNELFDYDLNTPLLEALGMNVPPQQPYIEKPVTTGFEIYNDFIGEGIVDASYGTNGVRNLYDETSPKTGDYCIYWSGVDQYGTIAFDFKPDRDLSLLQSHDHVFRLWARSDTSPVKIDIRFLDTKTSDNDHPWRIGKTIESIPGDQSWQLIEVSLKDLEEKGSWDNAWYEPEGKFDWTSVDRFEIVAEHRDLKNIRLWFDDIRISGEEVPYEEPPVTSIRPETTTMNFSIAPNPMHHNTSVLFSLEKSGPVQIGIYDMAGREVTSLATTWFEAGDHKVTWNGMRNGYACPAGVYFIKMKKPGQEATKKLLKCLP